MHLWWCPAVAPPPAALAQLQPEEHARAQRFHFERDRHRHLATRWLVRRVLSHYAGMPPADWRFADNAWGRPAIAAPGPTPPLHFNVSHSAEAIVMVVARHEAVGVDVESHRSVDMEGIAEQVFCDAERAWLQQAADAQDHAGRFLALWTLKEAYVKACGQGLSMPLRRFGLAVDEAVDEAVGTEAADAVSLQAPPDVDADPAAWRFWRGALRPGLPWAVAVRDPAATLRIVGDASALLSAPTSPPPTP